MKNLAGFLTTALVLLIPLGVLQSGHPPLKMTDRVQSSVAKVLLPARGLYVQFERRGYPSMYYSGEAIYNFNTYDPVVGHTYAEEISQQLDAIQAMGVNAITFELRAAANSYGPFVYPGCTITRPLGLLYPEPTDAEIANLVSFLDLVGSKGMLVYLRLVNTHMEESPPVNNQVWLGKILNAIKAHPALDLVLFEGSPQYIDSNGDNVNDDCGIPAEPPLWMGSTYPAATYIQWAIQYAHSLGIPWRKLSAQAIVGDHYAFTQGDSGPQATDSHLWDPIAILKGIFDNLGIPAAERTYALSFYEHRKCSTDPRPTCTDADPQSWALETVDNLFGVIGEGTGARVLAVEMGLAVPVDPAWTTEMGLESLAWIFENRGIDGGAFWRWTDFQVTEEFDPQLSIPIKLRSREYRYTPVRELLMDLYTTGQSDDPLDTPDDDPPVFESVLASPGTLGNGGVLTLVVDLGQTHHFVTVDPRPLDDGSNGLVVLIDQGDGTYTRDIPISLWNTQPNGVKTLMIQAMDFWSNASSTTVNVTLDNPPAALDWHPPDDDFSGTDIDWRKWMESSVTGGGSISQDERLIAATGTDLTSSVLAQSTWAFSGDFDAQVEFEIGSGWGQPASGHLGGATFGVMIDGQSYHMTRIRRDNGDDNFLLWSSDPLVDPEEALAHDVLSGRYRLMRVGTRLYFCFDTGSGWVKFGETTVPAGPAVVYLGVGSNDAGQSFTTYFDDFKINAGLTTYRSPFFLPMIFRP
jgi:hypothetical protein